MSFMDNGLVVRHGVVIPETELSWRFSRSSGPGGQSVNTTDSRVELSFDVAATTALSEVLKARALERLESRLVDGVLTVTASEQRSQWRNREAARTRLAGLIREAIAAPARKRRPPARARTRSGGAWTRRSAGVRRNASAAAHWTDPVALWVVTLQPCRNQRGAGTGRNCRTCRTSKCGAGHSRPGY